ncbi:MAG TPA: methyltransferase domain-containing protein [Actinomycetota bacterium]|jgi:2-polyprenyl-6-hydroxyphenyl methylase/3-demethylubiquinone-9 3-methyltransferase|nr:methyltransferase domain-containing protein [Actinomycetota bacterium]
MPMSPARPRNDPRQYDDLVDEWWKPDGAFAALHWLAAARAHLIPPAPRPDAVILDVGCGGGLMAPHVDGYRHVGIDLSHDSLRLAEKEGIDPVRGDAAALPFADGSADVVIAGELLEHVPDLPAAVAELARVLRPGGTVVLDTINDTWLARFGLVTIGERFPGGPPPRIHDPSLFVDPGRLTSLFARSGVRLRVRGLRPSAVDLLGFLRERRRPVRMLPTRSLAALYQGVGRKA